LPDQIIAWAGAFVVRGIGVDFLKEQNHTSKKKNVDRIYVPINWRPRMAIPTTS
jgi:hypothetical protein